MSEVDKIEDYIRIRQEFDLMSYNPANVVKSTVDNIELIKPFLEFESSDDFYFLQILKRKKENPNLGSNSRVIKNYYIGSLEYLENRYDEIKDLCRMFNARAVIRLNKRSYYQTGFKMLENVSKNMTNKNFNSLMKAYDSACGQTHNDSVKKWILDIDTKITKSEKLSLMGIVEKLGGEMLAFIPSKSGYHMITTPFRSDIFREKYPEIELQKENPTNLYIP